MSALSDLVKYAQVGDVIYKRGDHEHPYKRATEADAELQRLQRIEAAARELLAEYFERDANGWWRTTRQFRFPTRDEALGKLERALESK